MIQNLQQPGRIADPVGKGPEPKDDGINMDPVYEEEDQGGCGEEEEPPVGAPGGVGYGVARNPPQPMRREYLCERLCKMKPPIV